MSSNIKPKPTAKESPTEPFKRALTGCMRAIAKKPDLEVGFAQSSHLDLGEHRLHQVGVDAHVIETQSFKD